MFATGTLNAANRIHANLIKNVFRLPMRFFDVTPTGRIIGRFANDINGVDNSLPQTFLSISRNIMVVCKTCCNMEKYVGAKEKILVSMQNVLNTIKCGGFSMYSVVTYILSYFITYKYVL